MRLNINLATKPYQDVRRILLQWGGLVLLLAVCTVALVWTAVSTWRQSRDVNAKIAALQSEIAALDRQHAEAVAMLRLPQNQFGGGDFKVSEWIDCAQVVLVDARVHAIGTDHAAKAARGFDFAGARSPGPIPWKCI